MKRVVILGATGSIGASTIDVISKHPDKYDLYAVTGFTKAESLAQICNKFNPAYAVMVLEGAARELITLLDSECSTKVLSGKKALDEVAALTEVDTVVAAIVGAAGLSPTLSAVKAGKRVLLANKEALVMSGELFMGAVRESGAVLLPIDSEHNAIFQCLPRNAQQLDTGSLELSIGLRRVLLTASGGPFREASMSELADVTPEQACRHPNWSMGQKISVDSATLMNKGLELIEACRLFGLKPSQVDIHIHPESIIHSMVEYEDGSVIAQLGQPDMRTPIAYGLAWPDRITCGVESLNLFEVGQLNFQKPDVQRFPCLRLAVESFDIGGCAPAVLNAANEIAVAAFLAKRIRFTDIGNVVEATLSSAPETEADTLEAVFHADSWARESAEREVSALTSV